MSPVRNQSTGLTLEFAWRNTNCCVCSIGATKASLRYCPKRLSASLGRKNSPRGSPCSHRRPKWRVPTWMPARQEWCDEPPLDSALASYVILTPHNPTARPLLSSASVLCKNQPRIYMNKKFMYALHKSLRHLSLSSIRSCRSSAASSVWYIFSVKAVNIWHNSTYCFTQCNYFFACSL